MSVKYMSGSSLNRLPWLGVSSYLFGPCSKSSGANFMTTGVFFDRGCLDEALSV